MNVHLKLETLGHFINGAAVADGARTQPVFNPASGQVVREVSLAARATVAQAKELVELANKNKLILQVGFSTNTCLPEVRANLERVWCKNVGAAITTASTF